MKRNSRKICFVTGTRAEFGLMRPVLNAIKAHPDLKLQLIVTGMHLHAAHGRSIDTIRREGWTIDAVVPWTAGGNKPEALARHTGKAMASMAGAIAKLRPDVVLVVGDRVEAFAGASMAHVAGCAVAHVHGGDRALGQIDDSLRHAITKLAHIHFPATRRSAERIRKMGEDDWRIVLAGSPGIDGLAAAAASREELLLHFPTLRKGRYALLVLHPIDADPAIESKRARDVLAATLAGGVEGVVIIYPNNDPGSGGIINTWEAVRDERVIVRRDVPRGLFLGLMRDAAVMVGNSSAGIIEAASVGTPVVDIGPRQMGRERSGNVVEASYDRRAVQAAVAQIWNDGRPRRYRGKNVYGGGGAGKIIADHLASVNIDARLLRKLIAY